MAKASLKIKGVFLNYSADDIGPSDVYLNVTVDAHGSTSTRQTSNKEIHPGTWVHFNEVVWEADDPGEVITIGIWVADDDEGWSGSDDDIAIFTETISLPQVAKGETVWKIAVSPGSGLFEYERTFPSPIPDFSHPQVCIVTVAIAFVPSTLRTNGKTAAEMIRKLYGLEILAKYCSIPRDVAVKMQEISLLPSGVKECVSTFLYGKLSIVVDGKLRDALISIGDRNQLITPEEGYREIIVELDNWLHSLDMHFLEEAGFRNEVMEAMASYLIAETMATEQPTVQAQRNREKQLPFTTEGMREVMRTYQSERKKMDEQRAKKGIPSVQSEIDALMEKKLQILVENLIPPTNPGIRYTEYYSWLLKKLDALAPALVAIEEQALWIHLEVFFTAAKTCLFLNPQTVLMLEAQDRVLQRINSLPRQGVADSKLDNSPHDMHTKRGIGPKLRARLLLLLAEGPMKEIAQLGAQGKNPRKGKIRGLGKDTLFDLAN